MLRRLFIVLQYLGLIPVLIFLFFWLDSNPYDPRWHFPRILWRVLFSLIPYGLIILGKWIIYGTFNIFKIGQDIKPKKRDSSRKDDSKNSNQDFEDPPFPEGFWNIPPFVEDD